MNLFQKSPTNTCAVRPSKHFKNNLNLTNDTTNWIMLTTLPKHKIVHEIFGLHHQSWTNLQSLVSKTPKSLDLASFWIINRNSKYSPQTRKFLTPWFLSKPGVLVTLAQGRVVVVGPPHPSGYLKVASVQPVEMSRQDVGSIFLGPYGQPSVGPHGQYAATDQDYLNDQEDYEQHQGQAGVHAELAVHLAWN